MLRACCISKHFTRPVKTPVFTDISLDVHAGEAIAIVGKSGEGKTTLLHILGTLDDPTSGTIEICKEIVTNQKKACLRNRHIGFIFQAFHLLEETTALENVLIAARIGGKKTDRNSDAYARAIALVEEVGLLHRASFPVHLLSGGEKQRISVARALINDPEIILADEPSGNLDSTHAEVIDSLLLDLAKKKGKAVVIVTHNLELAKRCQKTYTLQGGRLT